MSEFSEMLESYVTAKKVNKYQMAKYLSVDRSSLHKIIQGQRNAPSKDLVRRIGNYLELTPYEIKELLELYSISLVSPDIYYRRKNVDTFIRSFHTEPTLIDMPGFQNEELYLFEDPVRPFHKIGKNLEYLIYHLVVQENKEECGEIKFLGTPGLPGFSNIFPMVKEQTSLKHILPLSQYSGILEVRKDRNFHSLCQTISLYAQFADHGVRYRTTYYHGNDFSHSKFPPFPYLIVTTSFALQISSDYQEAILYSDKAMVRYFHQIFDDLYELTSPLLLPVQDLHSQLALAVKIMQNRNTDEIHFSLLPCLVPFLEEREIQKYLFSDLPERKQFMEQLIKYIKSLNLRHKKIHPVMFMSENGVRRFMETGRFDEFSNDFYLPLHVEDRKAVLQCFIKHSSNYDIRLLKEDIGNVTSGLKIYISDSIGYLQFMTNSGKIMLLSIENPNFIASFKDYFESLDSDQYDTGKEAMDKILRIIDSY